MDKKKIVKVAVTAAILAAAKELAELALSDGKSSRINPSKEIEAEWHDAE